MYYNYDITHILNIYKLILSNFITIIYKELTTKMFIYLFIIIISIGILRINKQLLNKIYKLENTLQFEKDKIKLIEINEKILNENQNNLSESQKKFLNIQDLNHGLYIDLKKQVVDNFRELNFIIHKELPEIYSLGVKNDDLKKQVDSLNIKNNNLTEQFIINNDNLEKQILINKDELNKKIETNFCDEKKIKDIINNEVQRLDKKINNLENKKYIRGCGNLFSIMNLNKDDNFGINYQTFYYNENDKIESLVYTVLEKNGTQSIHKNKNYLVQYIKYFEKIYNIKIINSHEDIDDKLNRIDLKNTASTKGINHINNLFFSIYFTYLSCEKGYHFSHCGKYHYHARKIKNATSLYNDEYYFEFDKTKKYKYIAEELIVLRRDAKQSFNDEDIQESKDYSHYVFINNTHTESNMMVKLNRYNI